MAGLRPSLLAGVNIAAFSSLHFNPLEIDAVIEEHGNWCEYRKGQLCPCARIETGQGNISCGVCRGLGWVYPAALRCRTKFLDSSRGGSSKMDPVGAIVSGQMQCTFRIGIVPARGDMILPECDEYVVHEQFHRAVQQVSRSEMRSRLPPSGTDRALPVRAERLLYPDVFEMESVTWIGVDADGKDVIMYGKEGTHYRLTTRDGGLWVDWTPGLGPEQGKGYTVRYVAAAAYLVKGAVPAFRHEANVAMPYKSSLERLDKLQEDDLR